MPRFYLKPVFWNTQGYRKPSGVQATSGYPFENGYGHEEWNNAPFMRFEEKGNTFRVFHTEGLGNAPVTDYDGRIFVFLYASHNRIQQLVGAMGNATCLALESEDRRAEREILVEKLDLKPLWRDAWHLTNVRNRFRGDRNAFMRSWREDLHWIPNWRCPERLFFWPTNPVTLDPKRITGKSRLLNEFGRYTEIGPDTASRVMAAVPLDARTDAWSRIYEQIDGSFGDVEADVTDILTDSAVGQTTRQALVDARRGQGDFRARLMIDWNSSCAVTGCDQPQLLRASHIKP